MPEMTILGPGADYKDRVKEILYQYNAEEWDRGFVWPNQYHTTSTRLYHRKLGNIGISKSVSIQVIDGWNQMWNKYSKRMQVLKDDYYDAIKLPPIFSDDVRISKASASHMRETVGTEKWEFRLPSSTSGEIAEVGEALGMSKTQLYRHLMAVSLSDAEDFLGWEHEAPEEYADYLEKRIWKRSFSINNALKAAEDWDGQPKD